MLLRSTLTKTLRWGLAGAVIALAAGPAGAQPAGAAPGGTPANGAGAGADAQVGFQRRTQLSPQEEVVEGERMVARMEQAGTVIRRQLETARAARDVVKTLCLNDKLSQLDVAVRSARERNQSLKLAATRNDQELSNHEFAILTVLRERGEQLSAEANQCIGEEAAFLGDTKITTTVDPTLPGDETTEFPPDQPGIFSEPPPCVSCSR